MKPSTTLLAAEFKQKSRWTYVRPNVTYGAMFLPFGVGRILPLSGCNWVTRDSNRLKSFAGRYGAVLRELDVQKNEEELKVTLEDVRWNDHRRLYFKCSTCGEPYRKAVTSKIKYHAGCNACKKRCSSEVLKYQIVGTPVAKTRPDLATQLAGAKKDNIATFATTSKYNALWTCRGCSKEYRATIRQRTGQVEQGQAPLHPNSAQWTEYCEDCRWSKNMTKIGQEAAQKRQFLGLEESNVASTNSSKVVIPRRRRVVV